VTKLRAGRPGCHSLQGRDLYSCYCVQIGSGAHSCPMGTGGYFCEGKAAGPWSWPLTSI